MKLLNYFCILAVLSASSCTLHDENSIRREFYRGRAEQLGVQFIPNLPITVVLIPANQYNKNSSSYRESAEILLARHPVEKIERLDFWTPSLDLAIQGWYKLEKDTLSPLAKHRWKSGELHLVCQIFGVEIGGERFLVYNFVHETRLNRPAYYNTPDVFYDSAWPYGGSVLISQKDGSISWKKRVGGGY